MVRWTVDWMRAEQAKDLFLVHEPPRDGRGISAAQTEFLYEQTAAIRRLLHGVDTTGLNIRTACLRGDNTGCDAVWYANALWADVLCVPLSQERLGTWARLAKFRVGPHIHRPGCRLLLYRDTPE